jgi:hypothetical protein
MSDDVVVWENTVDGNTWRCWVTRDPESGGYRGRLRVARVSDGEVIHDEPVGLAYQAIFGPDVADVELWQSTALLAIDTREAT